MASFVPSQFDGAEMLFVETYPVFLWTPGAGLLSVHGHRRQTALSVASLGCSGFSRHSLFSQVLPLPALATTNPKPVSAHAPHPVFYLWGQQLYLQMQQLFPKGKPGSISEVGFSAVNHPFLPLSCLLASSASC